MIDTDKYEGHDLSTAAWSLPWYKKMNDAIKYIQGSIFDDEDEYLIARANAQLIADAALLLAEVKQLCEEVDNLNEIIDTERKKVYDIAQKLLEVIE